MLWVSGAAEVLRLIGVLGAQVGYPSMPGTVQASDPHYELQSLGWKSFQDLCTTIAADVLGQTVQAFIPSRDGGRDGAFHGIWKGDDGAALQGAFTVQCKFSSKDAALSRSALLDEVVKATRLASKGLATNYILMTNLRVSGGVDEALREQFLAIPGIRKFLVFGREWITLKIRETPALRMLVPRVYGLGDLSQIIDERAYRQALEVLSGLGDDLSKFVVTQSHTRAAKALVKHGFVLLLGEPAAGKSTIAASLAIGALDRWGCSTLKVRSPDEFVQHWNPHEPKQFFWIDDAFGCTQYQRELATEWNRTWPHMSTAIRKGARVLFTSRDYIYRAARFDLKSTAFPLINESQVVINVQQLTKSEKEQILYNHIKLGEQPRYFKTRIKPFLPQVATSHRFLPEIARRLGSPLFTRNLQFDPQSIRSFVERPIGFLVEVVTNLDADSRAALALVFMRGGALQSPIELSENEQAALRILGVDLASAREALNALDGSLLALVRSGDSVTWTFKHPTIGDAYAAIVAKDPELLDIYMSWTSAEKLAAEVTCGEVALEGVKVVVPKARFERFAQRLNEIRPGPSLFTFLATRCSRDFLELYLAQHPELSQQTCEPDSYLSSAAEVTLLARLQQLGLLPDAWRLRFVARAQKLAVETPDLDFLTVPRIRSLFREQELVAIRDVLRDELVPSLLSFVDDWASDCDSEDDPEEHFGPLLEVVDVLSEEFSGNEAVIATLKDVETEIESAIEGIVDERPEPQEEDDYYYERGNSVILDTDRSTFDDIDD
jgi:hypothetical protein